MKGVRINHYNNKVSSQIAMTKLDAYKAELSCKYSFL